MSVELTTEQDVRAGIAEILSRRRDEVMAAWRRRLQEQASGEDGAEALVSPDMENAAEEMLTLVLVRLRGEDDGGRLREAIAALTARGHAAELSLAHLGRWFIALADSINEVLYTEPGAYDERCELCQRRRVQADMDLLRMAVNEEWHHIARQELQRRDERHQAILQHASDAIVSINCETGRIQEANIRTVELTGYSVDELSGMEFDLLCPDVPGGWTRESFDRVREAGSLILDDVVLVRKDGATTPVDVRVNCITLGDQVLALATIRDITDRKRLQEEQRWRRVELERRVEERTEQLRWLTQFNESIIQSMPTPMLILDDDLYVLRADQAYLDIRGVPANEIEGKKLTEVFPDSLLHDAGLLEALERVIASGETVVMEGVRHRAPDHAEKILNFRIRRVDNDGSGQVILLWDDVTDAARRTYGLSLMYQIGKAMQGVLELPRLLFSILTCVTAGPAVGLGLNRAFLLLVDEAIGKLKGEMAVGPESLEHAHAIWARTSADEYTLDHFLSRYDELDPENMPLQKELAAMVFDLDDEDQPVVQAVRQRRAIVVHNAREDSRLSREFVDLLGANDFVIVPLLSGDAALGVIIADNLFSGNPITDADVRLLEMFSAQAGQALANAKAYQNLRDALSELEQAYQDLEGTQQKLVHAEQLAAIGAMAARVAHEIRNPLTTIGGFARTIARAPENVERSREHSEIIVEEVDRLELILRNLLNLARPQEPLLQVVNINDAVEDTARLLRHDFDGETLRLVLELEQDLPPVLADEGQLKQAFLNLGKNATSAMPEGGVLTIRTTVDDDSVRIDFIDSGIGIDDEIADKIFEPFFSTRTVGSGIGLAITRQIVDDHGGRIEATRNPDRGATFTIWLPVHESEGAKMQPEGS